MGCPPRFFFALASLARFALNVGFFERPLAAGALWGLATGEWALAANVAIFFELFWLDLFPAGTYIPPNSVASMLLTIGVSHYFGIHEAPVLVIPMLISLPTALLFSKVEYWQRKMQNHGYNTLIQWGRKNADVNIPGEIILRSLIQLVVIHAIFFSICLLVLIGTINAMSYYIGHLPVVQSISWMHLWFIAGIGGAMSLRVRRSYVVFLICLLGVVLVQGV